jgi:hypothetical protein
MCVIVVAKERSMTESELISAFRANGDGCGLSWMEGDKIVIRKGFMKLKHLKEVYLDEGINEKLPHVVHFRKASNKICQSLTHPFIVSERSLPKLIYRGKEPALFHNGVLPDWRARMFDFYLHNCKKIPDGDFSDSRFIAIITHFLGKNVLNSLGGKFVLFGLDKIDLYGEGFIKDEGIIASNSSYTSGKTVYVDTNHRRAVEGNTNPMNVTDFDFDSSVVKDIFGD